jgi:hypothetical protein
MADLVKIVPGKLNGLFSFFQVIPLEPAVRGVREQDILSVRSRKDVHVSSRVILTLMRRQQGRDISIDRMLV